MELLVGTNKGLCVLRGERGEPMELAARRFEGKNGDPYDPAKSTLGPNAKEPNVVTVGVDPANKQQKLFAEHGKASPAMVLGVVQRTWVIKPGEAEGQLFAGVAPAALFESRDAGRSWELNRALWDQPTRPEWPPGAGGLCLHSVATWPGDPDRIAIGISAVGVWLTEDGGKSWRNSSGGLVPRYNPEEQWGSFLGKCVHNVHRSPVQPDTMYLQFHGGVYRSDDAGESWIDIGTDTALPSDFGFPMVVDPRDPDRAFVIPLTADLDRVTPEGKVRWSYRRVPRADFSKAAGEARGNARFQSTGEGIFAAGDVRAGSTKQLVSAAGEGAAAALAIREHLRGHDARSMENALVGSTAKG